jgi:pyroglutamyl-peptidase
MPHRTLITGFLAFGAFDVNPSALLAESCGRRHVLLEVAFDAVDRFVDEIDPYSFDRLLMIGVGAHATAMQLECFARNFVGEMPDVRGKVLGPSFIEHGGPSSIHTTLWDPITPPPVPLGVHASDDAGSYLCNYAYYRALRRLAPEKHVGFLHVPPIEVLPIEQQHEVLARLLEHLEGEPGVHLQRADHV